MPEEVKPTTETTRTPEPIYQVNASPKPNYLIPGAIVFGALAIAGAIYFSPQAVPATKQPIAAQGAQKAPAIDPSSVVLDLEGFPSLGEKDAPVLMVEFSDFTCPFCKRFVDETKGQIISEYIDKGLVRFVRKDFITVGGQVGARAAEAAHCAGDQGKYWEYLKAMIARQAEDRANWSDVQIHSGYAKSIGLNNKDFLECLNSGKYSERVNTSTSEAAKFGATGTPHFFINGIPVSGAQPFSAFKQIIDAEIAKSAE